MLLLAHPHDAMQHRHMNTPWPITALLDEWQRTHRDEDDDALAHFATLADEGQIAYTREREAGHFTASSWLVSVDGRRTPLTHHRKLGRWLQLGGHADGDADLANVALKEAEEESGLTDLRVEPAIFDLDRHWIPGHKGVPGHWHHDVRFVVHAEGDETFAVSEESLDLAWRDIEDVAADESMDTSLRRMARRWLERQRR